MYDWVLKSGGKHTAEAAATAVVKSRKMPDKLALGKEASPGCVVFARDNGVMKWRVELHSKFKKIAFFNANAQLPNFITRNNSTLTDWAGKWPNYRAIIEIGPPLKKAKNTTGKKSLGERTAGDGKQRLHKWQVSLSIN